MKAIASILAIIGLYIVYAHTFGYGSFSLWLIIQGVLIALPFLLLSGYIGNLDEKLTAESRDDDASTVISEIKNDNNDGKFALFLRPFEFDGVFKIIQINLLSLDNYIRPGEDYFERIIADALSGTYKTVSLGKRKSEFGGVGSAGLIDNWEELILPMIDKSEIVIIMPATTPGTRYEIEQIIERGFLSKTIFVQPSVTRFEHDGGFEFFEEWNIVAAFLREKYDIQLPPATFEGAFVRFIEGGGKPIVVEMPKNPSPHSFAKAINKVID